MTNFIKTESKEHDIHFRDFQRVLTIPVLTQGLHHQIDDRWLSDFRDRAVIPAHVLYAGNQRLGFYYQWLWQQLITHHPDYELVAEELQLHENKRTLGAIDFLVFNKTLNQLEHWEVAIKFYLAYQQRWLGPNSADNLDRKINRMIDHQLAMTSHQAYRNQYAETLGQPVCQRLIVQGRLFDHFQDKESGSDLPINPHVNKGLWCFQSQASTLALRALSKREWLTPPAFVPQSLEMDASAITVPTQGVDDNNRVWFIVPDHWPLHNRDKHRNAAVSPIQKP
ncbi:DUF1853 family protein [Photobacterium galatheae]|uniref:Type II citrate synthase n=1 Tax=Photobacterium galatheae TaxID=1654360 RepID=A0A066RVX9_9GAMM|nr:DUF1853 family protein [Photobacterium galatheae]KDM93231.1 hypothetical protein EA58_03300 [Photobacterium galatheae]MCM0148241.1 DUF1853 family protein [Photobacterium galatheae]